MVIYDPQEEGGGLTEKQVRNARVILWKGYCSVHTLFTPAQCDRIRQTDPDMKIVVHPECDWQVVQRADLAGSTEFIIKTDPARRKPAPDGLSARRSTWSADSRSSTPTRRYAPSRAFSACALPCIASIPSTCCGCWMKWRPGGSSTGSPSSPIQSDLAIVALERMLANVPIPTSRNLAIVGNGGSLFATRIPPGLAGWASGDTSSLLAGACLPIPAWNMCHG